MIPRRTPFVHSSWAGLGLAILAVVLAGAGPACRDRVVRPDDEMPSVSRLDAALFDQQAAYEQLRALTEMGLRDAGTLGAERAAEYLRAYLLDLGLDVAIDVFTNMTPRGPTIFRNVIARIPGRSRDLIIIGSHYDTKSSMPDGFQGANDSGSSTAVLLELARVLSQHPPAVEIWFAFFDGEECMAHYGPNDGLHGSRRLAQHLLESGRACSVRAVIVLDMIGDCDLTVTIPRNSSSQLVQTAFAAAEDEGVRHMFSLFRYEIGDDHDPFLDLGVPAIDLIDFNFGSRPGLNDYWHSSEDRLEKVCPESLGIMGRVTLRMLNRLLQ